MLKKKQGTKCGAIFGILGAVALVFSFGNTVYADYPDQPFTYIVPFSPGGTTDLNARVFEKFWKGTFGVPMKVEYISGAGGQVGWDALVKREPNGYTVAGNNLPHIVMQPIFRETAYTTEDQIKGSVAGLVTDPEMISVLKDSPYKDLNDLIGAAEEKPGSITAGIVGKFTGDWFGLKLFEKATGTKFAEVIFPGSRPTVAALLGGHIDVMFGNTGDIKTLGPENVRTLAVGAEKTPAVLDPFLNQIGAPTAHEQGVEWYAAIHRGLVTVPGTPPERLKILREKVWEIINKEAYAKEMMKVGLPQYNRTGEEYAEFIRQQQKEILGILADLGYVKVEDGKVTVLKR